MLYGNKVGRIFHVQRVSAENTMIPTGKEYGLRVDAPKKDGLYIKERVSSLDSHRILRFTIWIHWTSFKNQALNVSKPPASKLLKSNGF